LCRGSDVEAKSGRGYTALILASTAGEKEVVEHLIAQV
jgi:ankyrin repeat protein